MEHLRVYGIDLILLKDSERIRINDIKNNEWIYLSEKQGFIWGIKGFELAFNNGDITLDTLLIRFIKL